MAATKSVPCTSAHRNGTANCPFCHGTGTMRQCTECWLIDCDGVHPCPTCDGTQSATCPDCDSNRYPAGETCRTCEGSAKQPCPDC